MKKCFWLVAILYIFIGVLIIGGVLFLRDNQQEGKIPPAGESVITQEQQESIEQGPQTVAKRVIPQTEKPKKEAVWPVNGWERKEPSSLGIDTDKLKEAVRQLRGDGRHFKSVLIIKDGYLAFEEYKTSNIKNEYTHIKSCTKSVMSILIGIAIKQRLIDGVDQRVEDFFPEYFTDKTEPLKKEMKLEHLLNMTAGFRWEQYGTVWSQWWDSKDRFKYTFSLDMSDKPGDKFNYSSAASHLLSGVIARKSGMSTLEYANKNLFSPLNIKKVKWSKDKSGIHQGNSELFLKPEDMAKIGYLYLKNGVWNGKQIVDEWWVKESTSPKAPETDYGYLWWIGKNGGNKAFYAAGYGGQFIYVCPWIDTVIVITSTVSEETNWSMHCLKMLDTYFIPAFKTNKE